MAALPSTGAVVEIADAAPRISKSPSPWVRGPVWDGFWILSALWLAPIVLWLAHGYSNPESSPLDLLYFGLAALFWIGTGCPAHISCTSKRIDASYARVGNCPLSSTTSPSRFSIAA